MRLSEFGVMPDGRPVHCLVIGREPGVVLQLLTLGATVHRLEVTGGDGRRRNLVLGHATVADRLASTDYIGGTIGRYANRIAGGTYPLDGREVRVATHDRGNSLHGGPRGFDVHLWEIVESADEHAVLRLTSPDGDMGFPGALTVDVRYQVDDHTVRIEFEATTDAPTLVNLTNHAYFNLDGDGAGTIDDHVLAVMADDYTPVDATGIPNAGHLPVTDTPFDFRRPGRIGPAVRQDHEQVVEARGIDHNYVVRGEGLRTAAVLESRRTGTRLEVRADRPGLQVYTGNFLDGSSRSAIGSLYRQGDGIALEPQLFPDSPNHPEWPSAVLRPGETHLSAIEWVFTQQFSR